MAKAPPSAKRDRIKAFTPALVDYTNDVVYGDLWERKALSKRGAHMLDAPVSGGPSGAASQEDDGRREPAGRRCGA
jgi:hypothetical protein